ncbi:CRISPR-associated endonuclease Cas1 [bacterium]|nr:CRISPR-associated endonuclease Cas1 [bacterium]
MTSSFFTLRTVYSAQKSGVILHAVLQAIMKESYMDAFPGMVWKNLDVPNIFYHVEGRRFSDVLEEKEVFTVCYFFCGIDEETVLKFSDALKKRMDVPENQNYYKLEEVSEPYLKTLDDLRREYAFIPEKGEITLDLMMPLPFNSSKDTEKTEISKELFRKLLQGRMKRLFGEDLQGEIDPDAFEITTDLRRKTLCTHQKNGVYGQRIRGCIGKITLKGDFSSFRDLLILACELHLGPELTTSQGYFVPERGGEPSSADDDETVAEPYKKPLYITAMNSFLGVSGGTIEIYSDRELKNSYPMNRIGEVIVLEKAIFSTEFLKKCAERDIPVSISLGKSDEYGTFSRPDKRRYEVLQSHIKKFSSLSEEEIVKISRDVAETKTRAFISIFRRRWEKGTARILKKLEAAADLFAKAETIDEIRGYEGISSRLIYEKIQNLILNEDFRFERRGRYEKDFMNTTLNFAYSKLYQRVVLTLNALGLNPYLGFLHSSNDRYESLACDIEELFRAPVFNAVINLINLQQLKASDFVETEKGIIIKQGAIRTILEVFEKEFQKINPKSGKTLEEELYNQCVLIKNWALGKCELSWFRWK